MIGGLLSAAQSDVAPEKLHTFFVPSDSALSQAAKGLTSEQLLAVRHFSDLPAA
jgi:hypothetical protein